MGKKAILAVSFGTSYEDTRKKTLEAIERELGEAFPGYQVYRAWTSRTIVKKLKDAEGFHVDDVQEAMGRMLADGVSEVVVQPTYIIRGFEYDRLAGEIHTYSGLFEKLRFGQPLLAGEPCAEEFLDRLLEEIRQGDGEHEGADFLQPNTGLVFMGHGTDHQSNSVYRSLGLRFLEKGYDSVFVGTVEDPGAVGRLLPELQKRGCRKLFLAPFMMVAGDHAVNDMAGDGEASWKSQLEKAGFQVTCLMRGLGEYQCVRKAVAAHAIQAK